jgi:hypothetical protein
MSVELAPLRAMLDTIHDDLPAQRDHNAYVLGELGKHNVVIAVLPRIGNNDSGIQSCLHQLPQSSSVCRYHGKHFQNRVASTAGTQNMEKSGHLLWTR